MNDLDEPRPASSAIDRVLDVARAIQAEANDKSSTEGGFLIGPRLIGRLDQALRGLDE